MAQPDLAEIGAAIADGTPLDWSARNLTPDDPELRALFGQLQLIERIARVHTSSPASATAAEFDSLLHPQVPADATESIVTWGPLTIVEKIGRGAFGDVYLAHDSKLDRPVALKLMRRRQRGADAFESEVIEEGRLLARVNHPNVVTVHGAERIDGRVGLWMAFVEGRTLADEIGARGPLAAREVIEIGVALADALNAVHAAGLLHRDIKAQNAMRDRTGRVLLMDFGAGRELVPDADGIADGPAGTPLYLAPEVLEGAPASTASDVYSLGVLLYHLATGAFPVSGRTLRDLRDAHGRSDRKPLRQANRELPARLVAVVERAITPEPARRFQTAADLRAALAAAGRSTWTMARLWLAGVLVVSTLAAVVFWRPTAMPPATTAFAEPGALTSVPVWSRWDDVLLGNVAAAGWWLPCTIQRGPSAGRLARCDLQTGAVDLIGDDQLRARPYPRVSPDGRTIAYVSRTGAVRLVGADGTGDRLLIDARQDRIMTIQGWTADAGSVVALESAAGSNRRLIAISATTASVHDLVPPGSPTGKLSPDERHLLISRRTDAGRFDVWTRELSTGVETRLVDDVWNRVPRPVWTPSGAVLFTSDRNGTLGLWRVEVRDGRATGPAQLVQDTGRSFVWPYGFMADGTFVHGLQPVGFASYEAMVDIAAARVVSSPRRLAAHPLDANGSPAWSPDGEWLAYVSNRQTDPSDDDVDVAGLVRIQRGDRSIEPAFPIRSMSHQTRVRWWPDGQSVVLLNGERRDRETGALLERLFEGARVSEFEIDARGRRLYYLTRQAPNPNPEIRVLHLATRQDDLVYTGPISIGSGFSLTPDGRLVAVVARTKAGMEIRVVETGTGGVTRAYPVAVQPVLGPFSGESGFLLYSTALEANESRSRIVVLDLASGDERPLDIIDEQIWQMQLHPDGRRLAFVAGSPGQHLFATRGAGVR